VPTGKDFRAIALALPEDEERETWGHPTSTEAWLMTAPKRLARELEE
jgi:hypothetical protein